jgi:hypothetical protein
MVIDPVLLMYIPESEEVCEDLMNIAEQWSHCTCGWLASAACS